MSKDDNYTDVLLEDMNGKFDRIIEAVGQLSDDVKKTATKTDVEGVKTDLKIVKAAVTDTNIQVNDHESRITNLEAV